MPDHTYKLALKWTGNTGSGTFNPGTYKRDYKITAGSKPPVTGSSDPSFRGDKNKYNPEELLVASLASCHMLWYLDLCTRANIIVVDYQDHPVGIMTEKGDGGGAFKEVMLAPIVTVAEADMVEKAIQLHKRANALCFIANSVNFPVYHNPVCKVLEM